MEDEVTPDAIKAILADKALTNYINLGLIVFRELSRDGSKCTWRRKDGRDIGFSFSFTLLDHAGGIRKLIEEWELVE